MPTGLLAPFFHAAGVGLSQVLLPGPAPASATTVSASAVPASAVPASPVPASADSASALPSWLLVALLVFVGLIVVAMFALTFYNLSAPRSTLKNVLGQKRRGLLGTLGFTAPKNANANTPPVSQHVIDSLGLAARVGKRTTRTTLAITGFSLLGVIVVAVFGVSGEGVRDLRNQVVTAVTTLVATIAGFYFGSDAGKNSNNNPPPPAATTGTPASLRPDPITEHSQFTIGTQGAYTPQVGGTPQVTISTTDALPAGLELDPSTGAITGTPTGAPGVFAVTLTAHNAFPPDATLDVTITITA